MRLSIMTASTTHCWKRTRRDALRRLASLWLALGLGSAGVSAHAETPAEVESLRLERGADAWLLNVSVDFKLPATVQDALLKGVPVIFVAEADILRERWYWTDKKVAGAARHMRLSFHPLTRRWRLGLAPAAIGSDGAGVTLNLNFDTLEEALATIKRTTGWRIAELPELDPDARYRIEFRFRLDAAQLPRPMQIGVLGQSDWNIAATATQKFVPGDIP